MTVVTRKRFLAAGAVAAAGLTAKTAPALASLDPTDLIGSWGARIVTDGQEIVDLMSFHPGGIVTEARRLYVPESPFGPVLESSGHGQWSVAGGALTSVSRFLLQQAPPSAGTQVGTDNVRLTLRLDNGRLVGRFSSTVLNTAGAIVRTAEGTVVAERIAI